MIINENYIVEQANIDVENPGLLEVPGNKSITDLSVSHFRNLIDKKGRNAIIRGITNIEIWNKNDDPKLSKWAKDMKTKIGDYGKDK